MSYRPLLTCPNPELRVPSNPVPQNEVTSDRIKSLVAELKEAMKEENGIGIAAPQIGVHERVIIVDLPDMGPTSFINPTIVEKSFKMINSEEGCLSVPGQWGVVKRHRAVTVTALNEQGEEVTIKSEHLISTVFQHEIDHLDGILFIDRAEEIERAVQPL